MTVFNLALETGPRPPPAPPRSPPAGALAPPPGWPPPPRPRVLNTRRGTLEDELDAPSTVVQAVPQEPVDDGHDLAELVDAPTVEPDVEPPVILSSRSSSGLRVTPARSVDTTSVPDNKTRGGLDELTPYRNKAITESRLRPRHSIYD